jgi:hypothetical protein
MLPRALRSTLTAITRPSVRTTATATRKPARATVILAGLSRTAPSVRPSELCRRSCIAVGFAVAPFATALSARVAVSYVTTINAVLNESALRTHTGSSNIVLLCASANLGRGCVAPRNTTDGLQIQEHVIGFRDSGTRTGTQYAYEFQAQASSVASRKLGYALMKTYLPNGAPRKVVDLFNTCPSYSFGAGQPALSCSGKGKCVAGKGGLNQCVCVDGFSGDDCSRGTPHVFVAFNTQSLVVSFLLSACFCSARLQWQRRLQCSRDLHARWQV